MNDLRCAYQQMFKESSPRYHLTLVFKFGVNDRVATGLFNIFMKYLNRAIFKERYSRYGKALKGFVVKESTPSMSNVHFHVIISDPDYTLPELYRMNEIIEKKIVNTNRNENARNKISKSLLQKYYEGRESSSLEKYLTKIFERSDLTTKEKISSICAIGAESVSFS